MGCMRPPHFWSGVQVFKLGFQSLLGGREGGRVGGGLELLLTPVTLFIIFKSRGCVYGEYEFSSHVVWCARHCNFIFLSRKGISVPSSLSA